MTYMILDCHELLQPFTCLGPMEHNKCVEACTSYGRQRRLLRVLWRTLRGRISRYQTLQCSSQTEIAAGCGARLRRIRWNFTRIAG